MADPTLRPSHVPILVNKQYGAPSIFTAEALLGAARRQKKLPQIPVPPICILDPDGDLVDYLRKTHQAQRHPAWGCYHTELDTFSDQNIEYGIVGRAVGAPFAVLVAEELFASGCRLLISITSAGQITAIEQPPYFILIEKALRDEGTSYHYLPPTRYTELQSGLREMLFARWDRVQVALHAGMVWTTDAPFRETSATIAACRAEGILAVEMEAAALYALATAKQQNIICFAHVTNQMGQTNDDFEKGAANGSEAALEVIRWVGQCWLSLPTQARP